MTIRRRRLSNGDGQLMFTATDNKTVDPVRTSYETRLQGMADRVAALDGELEVRSAPGAGTTIAGRIPVAGDTA